MLKIAMALRLKGMATATTVAEVVGISDAEALSNLETLVEAGHVADSPRGFRLLPESKGWLDSLLAEERGGIDIDAVNAVYQDFCNSNDVFKQLVTDWQLKEVDGEHVINDHTDADYDATIFVRLNTLDAEVRDVFERVAELAPRLDRYRARFATALAAVNEGDHTMMAAPLKDSYHTAWFEMHEELILLSGRNRADEAAAGRA